MCEQCTADPSYDDTDKEKQGDASSVLSERPTAVCTRTSFLSYAGCHRKFELSVEPGAGFKFEMDIFSMAQRCRFGKAYKKFPATLPL